MNTVLSYALILFFTIIWYAKTESQTQVLWENIQVEENYNYIIPEWYTWAITIVTNDNINEPIYQTWEELLYINEALWFQVLLWKERNWAKIFWTDKTTSEEAKYEITFTLPDIRYSDNFVKDDFYFHTVSIWIFDRSNPKVVIWNRDTENIIIDENNNLIYFIFSTFDIDELHHVFPSSKCTKKACPYLIDTIFCNWFRIFDV